MHGNSKQIKSDTGRGNDRGNNTALKYSIKRTVIKYIIAVMVLMAVSFAKILHALPFGSAMLAALSGVLNGWIIAPIYIAIGYFLDGSLATLYAAIAAGVVAAVYELLKHKFTLKPIFKRGIECAVITASIVTSYFFSPPTTVAVNCAFAFAFYWFFVNAARAVFVKQLRCRPNPVEVSSLCVVALCAALTFARASVTGVNIGVGLCAMLVLSTLFCAGTKAAVLASVMMGLGFGLYGNYLYTATFALAGCMAAAFSTMPRPMSAFAFTLGYSVIAFYFTQDAVTAAYELIAISACAALTCIVPTKWAKAAKEYFDYDGSAKLVTRHFINRTRIDEGNALVNAADVFEEMSRLMVGQKAAVNVAALSEKLMRSMCPNCPKNANCNQELRCEAFGELVRRAIKGKVLVSDLPLFFTDECEKPAEALHLAADVGETIKNKSRLNECTSQAHAIVCDRFKGVAQILSDMGKTVAKPLSFSREIEERLKRELCFNDIECEEAFVAQDSITLLVRAVPDNARLEKVVSKCLHARFSVLACDLTQAAGWSVVYMRRSPKFEAVFARAAVAKNEVSGDVYTFTKIENRFLAALADGMGSGEGAAIQSTAAVELIECFYKAGFDSESALRGVNNFLKMPASESYSAADVVVVDLETGVCDIIKIGSPATYIKLKDTVLKLESSSLPIGVLDEMRPFVASRKMETGQMLILTTDGVSDLFQGDELPNLINSQSSFNPKITAENILSCALEKCTRAYPDDMTVICIRIFAV